jgi:hypothetical protein
MTEREFPLCQGLAFSKKQRIIRSQTRMNTEKTKETNEKLNKK